MRWTQPEILARLFSHTSKPKALGLLGWGQLSNAGATSLGNQFLAAVGIDLNANASRLAGFRANQLNVRSVDCQLDVQTSTLWALRVASANVLVDLIDSFNNHFSVLAIYGQHGATTTGVVSRNDLNSVTFANVHLYQLRKHSIQGQKRRNSIPCNRHYSRISSRNLQKRSLRRR